MKRFLAKMSFVSALALSALVVDSAKAEMVASVESVGPRGRQVVYRHVQPATPYALTGEGKGHTEKMKLERVQTLGGMRDRTASYRWVHVD